MTKEYRDFPTCTFLTIRFILKTNRFLLVAVYFLIFSNINNCSAQTFIVMSDPQMGMFTENTDTIQEQANLAFVVASINRLKPAFVVVCGDLINRTGDEKQIKQYKKIISQVDPRIQVYNVAGNHDVGNTPTITTLKSYRSNFGPDYYTFDSVDIRGIVLDSNLISNPQNAPEESENQRRWLIDQLERARKDHVKHILIFQHIPYFLVDENEPDQYFNIPRASRKQYLDLFRKYDVSGIFAGHLHRNAVSRYGHIEMVTTGAIGKPLGGSQSGFRIAWFKDNMLETQFYNLGAIPQTLDPFRGSSSK